MIAHSDIADLVAGLADNKYFLGLRYAEWCTAAPTLESAVAAAAMAQDEIGHARSLYPLLRNVAGASPENEPETRTAFTNAPCLGESFQSWTDFVAANFLFDTVLTVTLEAARASSINDLATRARRMLEEEQLHWLHGEGWVRRLASKGPGVRQALLASFERVQLDAAGWLVLATDELVTQKVLDTGAHALRDRFEQRINAVLARADLPTI